MKLSKKRQAELRESARQLIEFAETLSDDRLAVPAATLATAKLLAVIEAKLPDQVVKP